MSDATPPTERVNPLTGDLDVLPTPALVRVLVRDSAAAFDAVRACEPALCEAVERIVERLERGGRLHYVGAGTSGRLGVLDAAEWPPTFGTPPDLAQAHIAGGVAALIRAVEGAEDDADAGKREAEEVLRGDAVVGISASGAAAFVVAALSEARAHGALTIALTNARASPLERACDLAVVVDTGAEAIAGSTRMKAGTAQKIVLTTLSTAIMVRLGKVYENLMVDVVAANEKLRKRALNLVASLVPADAVRAQALLDAGGGSVKAAILMGRVGVDAAGAEALLERAGGRLRAALDIASAPPT